MPPDLVIYSGGQTGADRAGLDWAIANGIPHGGWCPKGRRALDGRLPEKYQLKETPSADYLQRNEWNVRDTDGTVVFTLTPSVTAGSSRTIQFASQLGKPCLHIHPDLEFPGRLLASFVEEHNIKRLNVAGSRDRPGLFFWVLNVLDEAFLHEP